MILLHTFPLRKNSVNAVKFFLNSQDLNIYYHIKAKNGEISESVLYLPRKICGILPVIKNINSCYLAQGEVSQSKHKAVSENKEHISLKVKC